VVTRHIVGELQVNGPCRAVAFSADGTRLLSASGDSEFTVWNVAQGTKLASIAVPELKGSEGRSWFGGRVAVSRDLSLAAQAIGGGQIRIVDLASGKERWTAQAADENVTALAFSADGRKLASGAGFVESAVRLWDVASGRELARLEGHRTYVRSLLFWPDGETLASASGDQTIHLWDVSSLSPVSTQSESQLLRPMRPRATELHPYATLRGHRLEVWSLALGPDNATLVSGSKDGAVYVWDTTANRREQSHVTLPVPVLAWSFLADSRAILAVDKQGRLVRWQGNDFQQSQPLLELGTNAFAACFSADGRFLAAVSSDGTTQVWDVQRGSLLPEVTPKAGWDLPVKFLDRSNHLITQRRKDGIFREWDVMSGREIRSWQISGPGPTWKSTFSPDDQCFVALDGEGSGQLRHLATNRDTRLDLKQVSGTAFSPDGRLLAAVSILGVGHLYDTATGRKTATLQGFLQGAHSVSFSPDGQRLVIGSNGNEAIKLWDVESLQELLTLKGQGSMFNSVTFSPDGNVLASSNSRGILHIWRAPSFEEIARLEAQGR
jgi:WD40 repeat protein